MPVPPNNFTLVGGAITAPATTVPKAQLQQRCDRMMDQIAEMTTRITAMTAERDALQVRCNEFQALVAAATS